MGCFEGLQCTPSEGVTRPVVLLIGAVGGWAGAERASPSLSCHPRQRGPSDSSPAASIRTGAVFHPWSRRGSIPETDSAFDTD